MTERQRPAKAPEWPTLGLILACYLTWALGVTVASHVWLPLGIAVTVLALVLHASLQHEVLHGHPFANRIANEALVFLPLGLVYPYGRFRDTHLAHHRDERLTDPYDDPESNFCDPAVWARIPAAVRLVMQFNNTLLGRMVVGPAIGAGSFILSDMRAIRIGVPGVLRDWLLHLIGVVLVVGLVNAAVLPGWAYLLACYLAMSVLKIRTFLEHRAHERARGRTVVVERGGLLGFLFLWNNLHAVHHARPNRPWYDLPQLWRDNRADYLRRNEHYIYSSYGQIFRLHFLRAKDPVPHPLWAEGTFPSKPVEGRDRA